MRILTIANHLGSRGGLERTQMTNCRGLAKRGHKVDLLYVSEGDFAEDWRGFTTQMSCVSGTLPRRNSPLHSTLGVASAMRSALRLRPEIVYVYRYWDIPFAAVAASSVSARVVYHLCLPPPGRVPPWLKVALRRIDATVAVSEDTSRRWIGSGLPSGSCSVVPTGIDLATYAPVPEDVRAETRNDLGVGPDQYLVLYAGRIGREKGVDVLLRAAGALGAKAKGCHLVVIGSPSLGADPADSERYQEELVELARGLKVSWLTGRRDMLELIQAADVAVVPSLWPEPLSRSVLEPLACGVPVLATRTGGNPEILTGWLEEYLVEPGDPEDLATKLARLAHWRDRDPDLAVRCRRAAEARFSLDDELDAIETAMRSALDRAQPRPQPRRTSSRRDRTSCG